MANKFKMKDIGNPIFSGGDVTLNWLEYMEDGDVLYPGPKVKHLFSEESLSGKYEIFYRTPEFYFIRNLSTQKEQIICRTSFRPPNYKKYSIQEILQMVNRACSTQDIPNIRGISNLEVTKRGITFDVETKMFVSEHSLVTLDPDLNYFEEDFRDLMIHAFIVKDIFIPIKATVEVVWGESKPTVFHTLNANKHMRANCFGTITRDLEEAIEGKQITRIVILMLTALGNINLTDTVLWGGISVFDSTSPIKYIDKHGERHLITRQNFRELCPRVDVDFKVVNSILKRHSII